MARCLGRPARLIRRSRCSPDRMSISRPRRPHSSSRRSHGLIPADDSVPERANWVVRCFSTASSPAPMAGPSAGTCRGPWAKGSKTQGYQSRMTPAQMYRAASRRSTLTAEAISIKRPSPSSVRTIRTKYSSGLEDGKIKLDEVDATAFFKQFLLNTREGFFADPLYGGNKDMAAWKMIGFPGARYDYRDYVGKHGERYPLPPVSLRGRPAWKLKS